MFFKDVIVKLNYKSSKKDDILQQLGDPLAQKSDADNDKLVYILQKDKDFQVIDVEKARQILKIKKNKEKVEEEILEEIYAITRKKYAALTNGLNPLLNPEITDKLGVRIASAFVSNMAKILALFITAALMSVLNLAAIPLVFSLSYFIIHIVRYKFAFNRWPNKREIEHILGYALAAAGEMVFATAIFALLSGASIFAPISIHLASIIGLALGGPLVTYVIVPILMATIIAAATTLYNIARVLITHFFDIRFHFNKRFPFFFTINLKKERESLRELGKKLFITAVKEFVAGFIATLISVYLSYIPGALLAGYLSASAISAATTSLFTVSMQIIGALINSFIITLALDKLFDTYFNPKMSKAWDDATQPISLSKDDEPVVEEIASNTNTNSPLEEKTDTQKVTQTAIIITPSLTQVGQATKDEPKPVKHAKNTEEQLGQHSLFHHADKSPNPNQTVVKKPSTETIEKTPQKPSTKVGIKDTESHTPKSDNGELSESPSIKKG